MQILVVNNGSSSIKYQLYRMSDRQVLAKDTVERVGNSSSFLKHQDPTGETITITQVIPDHKHGMKLVLDYLTDPQYGAIQSMNEITAIGHRVVHGGELFKESTLIDDNVIEGIQAVSQLAPLHNPHNLTGIKVCTELIPEKPQVAVFDTVFHQTMDASAFMYALPYRYYQDYKIRKYGFHGTSHKYVSQRAAELMGKSLSELKLITCHLGNGASITAVKNGKSVDTSMGFTPLEGLMMGTRCGDLDPAIIPYLLKTEKIDPASLDRIMNYESGLYGISGLSNDLRDIEKAAAEGNQRAQLALDMYIHRIRKYIGSYLFILGGADAIVFTAGVGENQSNIRQKICADLQWLNIHIDQESNQIRSEEKCISTKDSSIEVWVIPTNEELMIAEETANLIAETALA